MSFFAISFGVLLTILGGGFYIATDMVSVTALIPAFFGIALIVLGVVARNEKLRMHAMHVAALLGLVGFALPAYRLVAAMIRRQSAALITNLAESEQFFMSALCLIFLGLCVKSFIDARVARKRKEAEAQAGS